jgi:hypothetical protein
MITLVWSHIIHHIVVIDADLVSPYKENSIDKDLLITLQLTHSTNATCISYDDDS